MLDLKMVPEIESKFSAHEQVCAQRYESIDKSLREGDRRMTKIEYLLYGVMLCVLFGPGVAGEFVKKLLGL